MENPRLAGGGRKAELAWLLGLWLWQYQAPMYTISAVLFSPCAQYSHEPRFSVLKLEIVACEQSYSDGLSDKDVGAQDNNSSKVG